MPHEIPSADLPPLDRLRRIMHLLRAPGGCPWDAEQTHASLVRHLLEEAYEVAAAVRAGSRDELVDELGDLLLQPVFHAEIASETGAFDLDDVARARERTRGDAREVGPPARRGEAADEDDRAVGTLAEQAVGEGAGGGGHTMRSSRSRAISEPDRPSSARTASVCSPSRGAPAGAVTGCPTNLGYGAC